MAQSGSSLVDRSLVAVEVAVGVAVVAAIIGKAYGPAPTFIFLLTGVAVAFTIYVSVRMLSALKDPSLEVTGRVEDEARAALEHEKLIILQGIKELEADAAVGKVDPEDYRHLRAKSEADALRIIQALKAQDDRWMAEARRLVTKRLGADAAGPEPVTAPTAGVGAAPASTRPRIEPKGPVALPEVFDERPVALNKQDDVLVCEACDTKSPADAYFCVGCGRPRQEQAAA